MPSIFFCPLCPHGRAIPQHTSLNSPHYVCQIKPWIRSPQLSSSTSVPSPQPNAPSYQGTLPSLCQLTTHLKWLRLSLELPTQVSVNFAAIISWQLTYGYVFLQLLHVLDKLIVKIHLHVVSGWQVRFGRFWPHSNKGVSKCSIVSECKRLDMCN